MKAWIVENHGGPEALTRKEMPIPEPGAREVRVKVLAVGLNHLDVWIRKGVEGHKFPLPLIPGCDIVGEIDCVGRPSQSKFKWKKGTRVVVNPTVSCGNCAACKSDHEPLCKDFGIIGETQHGGLADFVIVPDRNVFRLPPKLSVTAAASLPIAFVTAWQMLHVKAQLKKGEWILIHGAGSGVSVAAIQIAKLIGAKVIVTSADTLKLEKAKKLGANFLIHTHQQSFRGEVKKILLPTGKRGVDVVLDHVGVATFEESLKCLDWGGRLVTCGATTGGTVPLNLKAIFFKNLSILGSTMGSRRDFVTVLRLATNGKLRAVVDHVLPMEMAPEAFAKIENRELFGKVVLVTS